MRVDEYYGGFKTIRLGNRHEGMQCDRSSYHARPLLVKFDHKSYRTQILNCSKNLKYSKNWMKKVGVTPEYSKADLEIEKNLRKELNRRKAMGDSNWLIRRGKLVSRNK